MILDGLKKWIATRYQKIINNVVSLSNDKGLSEGYRNLTINNEPTPLRISKNNIDVDGNLYVNGIPVDVDQSLDVGSLNDLSDVTYSSGDLTITSLDTIISGNLTFDSSGDITLDVGGTDIYLKANGTIFGLIDGGVGPAKSRIFLYEAGGASTDDYFLINTTANGATSLLTLDDAGADAHLTLSPDGNLIIDAAGEVDFNTSTAGFTAQTGTDAVSIDWGEGNKYHLLLDNSSTVTFATNPSNPCNLILKIAQGNGGSKTITWAVTSGTIYWAGGGILNTDEPTLTTTDDKTDILSFYFDGTNYYGVASLDFDTT